MTEIDVFRSTRRRPLRRVALVLPLCSRRGAPSGGRRCRLLHSVRYGLRGGRRRNDHSCDDLRGELSQQFGNVHLVRKAGATPASLDNKITYTVLRKPSSGSFAQVTAGLMRLDACPDNTTTCTDTSVGHQRQLQLRGDRGRSDPSRFRRTSSRSTSHCVPPTDLRSHLSSPVGAYLNAATGNQSQVAPSASPTQSRPPAWRPHPRRSPVSRLPAGADTLRARQ